MIDNFEHTYFHHNGKKFLCENNNITVESFFQLNYNIINVERLYHIINYTDIEEEEMTKDNVLTVVYKAKIKNKKFPFEHVAIKKIKKMLLKKN